MKNGIYIENWAGLNAKVHYKNDIVFYVYFFNGDEVWYNENGEIIKIDGPEVKKFRKTNNWYFKEEKIPVNSEERFIKYLNMMMVFK